MSMFKLFKSYVSHVHFIPDRILAYFLQPQASAVQNIYNLPFSWKTWTAFLLMLTALFLASLVFAKSGVGIHSDSNWWSSQNLFWIICVGCQKGNWELTFFYSYF